jgi:hypothetical protein
MMERNEMEGREESEGLKKTQYRLRETESMCLLAGDQTAKG